MLKTLVITRSKDFQIHIEGELRGRSRTKRMLP